MIAFDLILKLSLLVTLAVFSGFLEKVWNRTTVAGKIAQGLLFGLTAIIGMKFPFELTTGLIFDGRTIVISLVTLFFGPISGGIASLLALVYRLSIGGVGLPMGIGTIFEAFIVGYYFYRIKERRDIYWLTSGRLLLFGFIVHLIMGLLIFILPSKYAHDVLDEVALTIILVYPIISLLIGKILLDQEVSIRYLEDLFKRESLYRTTLYSIGDAVITTDSNRFIHNMNSIAERLTGWKEKDAKGREVSEVFNIVNEFTLEKAENPVERVLREGIVVGLANHTLLITKDGRKIPIADSGAPIKDEKNNIIGVVLVFRDQTKEREYLRKIEEGEKRYKQFVHFSTDGIWRFDLIDPININLPIREQISKMFEGAHLAECNDAYAKMYGYQLADEIQGILLTDLMKPEDKENIDYLTNFIENGYRLSGGISKEYDKSGNIKYFENNLVGIIEDGYLVRAWGTQKDITDKYLLQKSLQENEEKFRLLAEASLLGIFLIQENKFAYVNNTLATFFGYEIDEVIETLKFFDLVDQEDQPIVLEHLDKLVRGEEDTANFSFRGKRKDGIVLYLEVFSKRAEFAGKVSVIGTMMDITEKVRLDELNRIRTQQFESTLETTPNVAIQFYNIDGEVLYWNKASENIFGWSAEEAFGKTLDQLILNKEDATNFKNVLRKISETNSPYGPFETKFNKKDGKDGWVLSTTFSIPSTKKEKVFVCMDVDITEKKKAEIALKEQLDLFQTLINTLDAAILIYRGKDILFCNEATFKITGYSSEEIYSMPAWDLVHPEQRQTVKNNVIARFKGEPVPNRYEIKLLTKDGRTKFVDFSVNLFTWKGELSAFGTAIDISERKFNEEVVRIQYVLADAIVKEKSLYKFFELLRRELSKLMDTTNLFVAFYEEDKDELYSPFEWDEKMDAPVRWSAKKSLSGKVVKEGKTLFLKKEEIQKLIDSGEIELIGTLSECWLGVPLFVENKPYGAIVVQSYSDPNSFDSRSVKFLELIGSQLSIYVIKKIQSEELIDLSLAINKSQVGVVIVDKNGIIRYVNPKFTEITGYSADELIGKNPRILKSGYHTKEFYENLWSTILNGKDWEGEFLNRRKNGELYWDRGLISPVFNEQGKITHFIAIREDITEQKKLIEEIVSAKEKALESERLKTAFLANISHEVRTPLNGLMGFAQILESQNISPQEVKRYANIIIKKANDLLTLFNEILDLSLIETGQLKVNPKLTNINSILYDVYSTFLLEEKVKQKEIELRIGSILPEEFEFMTDPMRLKQILNNLVENAIKFTKRGYVELGAKMVQEKYLQFYVKDTGIGIPRKKFDYIFERFQQIDSDFLRREYEGAGLGLPLCKGLVNLLNGKIWVESEVGEGSTFYFTLLPLVTKGAELIPVYDNLVEFEKELVKNEVVFLVAEDDYVNYFVLEKMLHKTFNCKVLHVANGKDAVELAKSRKDINLILLDIRMPIVDGFTAFKEIKSFNPSVPIIAVTAYAFPEDKRKILEMGFDDYVSKPFDFSEIVNKINKILLA